MKRLLIYIGAIAATLSMTSCNDVLNVNPVDSFTDVAVWKDLSLSEAYLNASYSKLKAETEKGSRFASLTDEVYQMHTYGTENVRQGYLSPDNYSFGWEDDMYNPWSYFYNAIGAINSFMEKIDKVPANSDLDTEWKNEQKGQGYFLRAYFYHILYSYYGRVPIITHTYNIDDRNFTEQRASMDDVANYIALQCDSAAAILPVQYSNAKDFGRATKGAALALKGRVLLWAASPLFGTPSAEKWQKAADANKAVIDLLNADGTPAYYLKTGITSSDDYANLFLDPKNPEVIFEKQFDSKWAVGNVNSFLHQAPCGTGSGFGGWSTLQPTENIVEKFEMSDGSQYVPSSDNTQNPWINRDIRLHADIFCDGDTWGYGSSKRDVQFYTGATSDVISGKDSRGGESWWNGTMTGYNMKKFLDPNFDTYGTLANTTPWFFLRLSEVYLNYAECEINLGNNDEALTYINKIRTRAALPAHTSTSDIWNKYLYERQIELLFEGQRWVDIRRWETAENEYNNIPISGLKILKYTDGHKTYTKLADPIEQRIFYSPKNYWIPVPRYEARKAPQIDLQPYE